MNSFKFDQPTIKIIFHCAVAGLLLIPYLNGFKEITQKSIIISSLLGLIIGFFLIDLIKIAPTWLNFLLAICGTVGLLIGVIFLGEMISLTVTLWALSAMWGYRLLHLDKIVANIQKLIIFLTRSTSIFLVLFTAIYLGVIPLQGLILGYSPGIDSFFDIIIMITICLVWMITIRVSGSRIAALFTFIQLAFIMLVPGDWILDHWEKTIIAYSGTFYCIMIIMAIIAINAGLVLGRSIWDTRKLFHSHKSVFWGPIFNNFRAIFEINSWQKLDGAIRKKLHTGIKISILLMVIIVPCLLTLVEAYPIPVLIHPQPYQVKFNFFAGTNIDNYTSVMKTELNEHQVNLDLVGFSRDELIPTLSALEIAMPNVTYRLSMTTDRIDHLSEDVQSITELLLTAERDDVLDQWRGYFVDVEGEGFRWDRCYNSIEESIGEWNQMFDYLENVSEFRSSPIEMECVSSYEYAIDYVFDNDYDNQAIEGYNSYDPQRFSSYAPMVYRCWPTWGHTDYYVYASLYSQASQYPAEKRGVYLGITNTSCYSRDVPQSNEISWGECTGFGNLIRDVLIAKHFRIPEVTFFVLSTSQDNGATYGGVFESYGDNFLDRLNESVNTFPPSEFEIYYNHRAAEIDHKIARDLVCDLSRLEGLSWYFSILIIAIFHDPISSLILRKKQKKGS